MCVCHCYYQVIRGAMQYERLHCILLVCHADSEVLNNVNGYSHGIKHVTVVLLTRLGSF